jgi:hypothetical protein
VGGSPPIGWLVRRLPRTGNDLLDSFLGTLEFEQ